MKFLSLLLTVLLACSVSFADTLETNKGNEFLLNRAEPGAMQKAQLGKLSVSNKKWVLKGTYDFAQQTTGTVGTYNLRDQYSKTLWLPKGAIINNCIIDVLTAPQGSTGATIALGTGQAGNDLKVAATTGNFSGRMACVPVGTAATSIKLTANRSPTLTIGTNSLSAGKIDVLLEYFLGAP